MIEKTANCFLSDISESLCLQTRGILRLLRLTSANLGLAATCNSVGMQLGWLLGFVVFTTLGMGLGVL